MDLLRQRKKSSFLNFKNKKEEALECEYVPMPLFLYKNRDARIIYPTIFA